MVKKDNKEPVAESKIRPINTKSWFSSHRTLLTWLGIGILGGFLLLTVTRFFFAEPAPPTHYHANFAVYIDGVREEFKEFTYYEEIAACSEANSDNPASRVHMHDQVNDVIHVHDKAVTYGQFFEVLGWAVAEDVIISRDKVYQTSSDKRVKFMLNGKEVSNIASTVIGSTDRLLVSYDSKTTDFNKQFESVASSADQVNHQPDPAACGGAESAGFIERLKHATFWE